MECAPGGLGAVLPVSSSISGGCYLIKMCHSSAQLFYTASNMNTSSRISICLALLLFVCLDTCESSEAMVKSNVSYKSVTGLDFVEADERLVYGDANPGLQYGLLWLPKKSTSDENPPLIVLIHGGCWLNAYDIQHSYPLSSALAEAGYAVWSPTRRPIPQANHCTTKPYCYKETWTSSFRSNNPSYRALPR